MDLTLKSYIEWVESGKLDPKTVADSYLKKAKELNSNNAFLRFHEDYVAKNLQDFSKKPLHGAPIWIKDIILTKWYITSCASKILEDFVSPYSATCFEKLESQWWLMIGKTNMDEFAMWGSTENSAFGISYNPYGTNRVPGGSSGGSAVAVASDMCIAALGTDTGWSVRQPASFCGIVGIKPTYGRVSRYWVQSMASSLDQVWVMTKTVEDAQILLSAISRYDPRDAQSSPKADEPIDFSEEKNIKKFKIAVPKEVFAEGLNPKVKTLFLETIEKIRATGITIEDVDMPILGYSVPMYYTIMPAEVSTNLARFDGIKFGLQEDMTNFDSLVSYYEKVRSEWFGDEVKRRILLGTFVLSSANYEGFYLKAQKARDQLKQDFDEVFKKYDLILTPTAPDVAWKTWAKSKDPLAMYLEDLYTIPANMWWLPAMSVTAGKIEDQWEMMPVGIQLIWNKWQENKILALGKLIEWLK